MTRYVVSVRSFTLHYFISYEEGYYRSSCARQYDAFKLLCLELSRCQTLKGSKNKLTKPSSQLLESAENITMRPDDSDIQRQSVYPEAVEVIKEREYPSLKGIDVSKMVFPMFNIMLINSFSQAQSTLTMPAPPSLRFPQYLHLPSA